MRISAIIPARYASSRFPAKPLALIGGKPMIERVYESVLKCQQFQQVVVATDDERIANCVHAFGGNVMMTRSDHQSGTDRIAEAARQLPDTDVIVNVQGDEPFIQAEQLDQVCAFFQDPRVDIATLAHPLQELDRILDANVVKVAMAASGRALYFSRSPIPYLRGLPQAEWPTSQKHFQHLGIYAYRTEVLIQLTALPPSPLEQAESLEQLRWLEAGYSIYVGITPHKSIGVDTPEDLAKAEHLLKQRGA
jgi:3-deoxy-manno-octulosonate cytidylyltransferase (CMP-KDO synthetase)